jgi:trans-aconitate 2-methyltransferase
MPTWDEKQYLKFVDARTRPAQELLARVPVEDAQRVVDLGCGPGNSTALLRERWPSAHITGLDSSPEMLRQAGVELPDIEFVQADVSEYRADEPLDVLFANAVMQWVPNHAALYPKLLSMLRPGGALAIQVPYNFAEPSHRAMRELRGWAERVRGVRADAPVELPSVYYDLLAPAARSVDLWQTRYEQVMADAAAIVEWVKGTGLRPFLEALPEADHDAFLRDYTAAIADAYPERADGKRLFPFPRLFLVVVR